MLRLQLGQAADFVEYLGKEYESVAVVIGHGEYGADRIGVDAFVSLLKKCGTVSAFKRNAEPDSDDFSVYAAADFINFII